MAVTITQEFLHSRLNYDPITGYFTWKPRPLDTFKSLHASRTWHTRFAGQRAGTINLAGYRAISLNGTIVLAHRAAWMMLHGHFPDQIDHINHNRDDNRIANLRPATNAINGRNISLPSHNTSGRIGVYWQARSSNWSAKICFNGKRIHLGTFASMADATAAREQAEIKFRFHENHGAANDNIAARAA